MEEKVDVDESNFVEKEKKVPKQIARSDVSMASFSILFLFFQLLAKINQQRSSDYFSCIQRKREVGVSSKFINFHIEVNSTNKPKNNKDDA